MSEPFRKVRLTPTLHFQANPHRGCCTFHAFNGDPLHEMGQPYTAERPGPAAGEVFIASGYVPCTVAYFRWYWADLQPEEERFDFTVIEKTLESCRRSGQTLLARIMPYGGGTAPQLPAWYANKYPVERGVPGHPNTLRPNHNSAEYLASFGKLLRELGLRFDRHPQFEGLDMSFVGAWGEGGLNCSVEQAERFAKVYQEAFPTSFRFSLTDYNLLTTAIQHGAGWRADAFGDLGNKGSPAVTRDVSWNHMFDIYPKDIAEGRASNVWKSAPVLLESIYAPKVWDERGFDFSFVLQQGLKYHATFFNPKYIAIPPRVFDAVEHFCAHIGYNFVYRQAYYQSSVKAGGSFKFTSWIENIGVAPLYKSYAFALRFRQGDREEIVPLDGVDPRAWLPGDIWLNRQLTIPQGFRPGVLELAAGLIEPESGNACVSFSVEENFSDRWLALGFVELSD